MLSETDSELIKFFVSNGLGAALLLLVAVVLMLSMLRGGVFGVLDRLRKSDRITHNEARLSQLELEVARLRQREDDCRKRLLVLEDFMVKARALVFGYDDLS